jgi:hypothetical protein
MKEREKAERRRRQMKGEGSSSQLKNSIQQTLFGFFD